MLTANYAICTLKVKGKECGREISITIHAQQFQAKSGAPVRRGSVYYYIQMKLTFKRIEILS